MKTIEEYAVDMVVNGAESLIEDDLNEGIRNEDHAAACNLGMAIVRAIREYPDVLVAMGRREQIEVPEADDSALFGLSVEQEIRARAADSAARLMGPICAAITTVAGEDAPDDMIQRFANAWGEATRGAATYIATGAALLPSPTTTGTAKDEA